MGFLDSIRATSNTAAPLPTAQVRASASPLNPALWPYETGGYISRQRALTVPAIARARGIICSSIGSLPLKRWAVNGNRELSPIPLQYQPDPSSPKAVTYSYLADSIFFYGIGYTQVLSVYSEDQRPSRMRWIDPLRVNPILNETGTLVIGYQLDGVDTPNSGVGRIIAFPGLDEGLLQKSYRTIETAIELEEAANRSAKEPTPNVVLKNKGADLPDSMVDKLMVAWKTSRRLRDAAYVNDSIDVQPLSFSPEQQQLVAARQFHISEIARAAGVPAWYLNAESASATYSNVASERRSLVDFALRPILVAIEQRLSMDDVISRDLALRFDLDNFLRGNPQEQVQIVTQMLDAGLINIARAQEMLDIIPEGNNS